MKYMTFQNSCSFCCLANMLAEFDVDTTDREIVLEAGLPYIFRYEKRTDSFMTGTMLQTSADYNRAIKQHGFLFVDCLIPKIDVTSFLAAHPSCMIGLSAAHGKNAMVFIGMEGSDFCFLNPHREADGQQDYVLLSEADILSRIEGESHIGYLKPRKESHDTDNTMASVASANALLSETLAVLEQYKKRMTAFCQDLPSHAEIMAIRDSLLRPIALEMPVMMELTRETALQSKLLLFQKQILGLFRSESGNTTEKPDPALLHEILEDYQSLVLIFNRKSN